MDTELPKLKKLFYATTRPREVGQMVAIIDTSDTTGPQRYRIMYQCKFESAYTFKYNCPSGKYGERFPTIAQAVQFLKSKFLEVSKANPQNIFAVYGFWDNAYYLPSLLIANKVAYSLAKHTPAGLTPWFMLRFVLKKDGSDICYIRDPKPFGNVAYNPYKKYVEYSGNGHTTRLYPDGHLEEIEGVTDIYGNWGYSVSHKSQKSKVNRSG